jgi:hypothetical protein
MQKNKKGIGINIKFIAIALVIAAIIYFGFANTGSIIQIYHVDTKLPLETGTFNFAGQQGTYETVRLGCINGDNMVVNDNTDANYRICNSYDSSQKLILTSSLDYSGPSSSQGNNYIETKIKLPAGRVNVHYTYEVNDYYSGQSGVFFNIDDYSKNFKTSGSGKGGHTLSGSDDYSFTLNNAKEVTFRVETQAGQKSAGSKGTMEITSTSSQIQVEIPTPPKPEPNGFQKFILSLINWFKGLFGFGTASIIGQASIQPNTQQTYTFNVSALTPDSDYSDGTYQVQYANWALTDKDGNIKQQGDWEQVNGNYLKSVTITTPSNIGNYVLLGVITQYDLTFNYDTGAWTNGEEKIVNKEAIDLTSKRSVTTPVNPTAGGFSKFLSSLFSWIKGIFGGTK